jgi:8-oxo-dGTP pyrophosphatase MutT (NUDIX family)
VQFEAVVERLKDRLSRPLPGAGAHASLEPQPRFQRPDGLGPAAVRDAAGLVLLFPIAGRPYIVLTVRAGTLERHSGQVSLPGGVVEPGETFAQAALREAREEVELPSADAHVIGLLTPLDILVSGFRLHPVVATMDERPTLRPADGEVESILEVPLDALFDPACLGSSEREREGRRLVVPAFHVAGQEIWGATAMVLAEFLSLLGWPGAF